MAKTFIRKIVEVFDIKYEISEKAKAEIKDRLWTLYEADNTLLGNTEKVVDIIQGILSNEG